MKTISQLALSEFDATKCPARVGDECHYEPQIEVEYESLDYGSKTTWRDFGSPPCRPCIKGLEAYEKRVLKIGLICRVQEKTRRVIRFVVLIEDQQQLH